MSHPSIPSDQTGMSPSDVADFIANHVPDRRGSFVARPILLQKLNEFGSPSLAVLTFESAKTLTIAGLLPLQPEDEVVLYDDNAPDGAQSFYGVVEEIRDAIRPTDILKGMRLIYIQKKASEKLEASEQTETT
jgi:hypothetical protein